MKFPVISLMIILFLSASTVHMSAQSRDKQASEILNEVTAKTLAYETISLDFSYRMENADANINEVTEGTALLSGDKYRLEIAGQTIISNGETIWTVLPDAEEVQINDAASGDEIFTPTKMLTNYNMDYKSKLIPRFTSIHGKNVHALELTPNERKSFEKVNLYIDSDLMQLFVIEVFDQNGSKYTYKITRFDTDIEPDKTKFEFDEDEFPEYYLIDMR
jgi:outer membrane lipoprotein carrier protein